MLVIDILLALTVINILWLAHIQSRKKTSETEEIKERCSIYQEPNPNATIEEIDKAKQKLELEITHIIQRFEFLYCKEVKSIEGNRQPDALIEMTKCGNLVGEAVATKIII